MRLLCRTPPWRPTVDHVRTKAGSCSHVLRIPSCAMVFGPGGGGNTRGRKTSPTITRTVTNDGRLISEGFLNGHAFIKMCIVCILFLLAVHRLVLIVNSLGCCWGERYRRGEEGHPHTTETVFCSGPMNPSLLVFVLFVFSLSWRTQKGSVLQMLGKRRRGLRAK